MTVTITVIIILSPFTFLRYLQALEKQVQLKEGYRITDYNEFKFKDDKSDPYIKIIPFEDTQLVVAMDPKPAMVCVKIFTIHVFRVHPEVQRSPFPFLTRLPNLPPPLD